MKYASESQNKYGEYAFNFHRDHLKEIEILNKKTERTFLALICVNEREICCLSHQLFIDIIAERKGRAGYAEDQYMILVTAMPRKKFRVYANSPGTKGKSLTQWKVARSDFPEIIF